MASRNSNGLAVFLLVLGATPLAGQTPAPLRLSFAEAVRRAAGDAPAVELAGLRTEEAQARVRQARGTLLPSLSFAGVPALRGLFRSVAATPSAHTQE